MPYRPVADYLRPVLLRRGGTAWQYAAMGGNTDWLPLAGSEGLPEYAAIAHCMQTLRHLVERRPEADVDGPSTCRHCGAEHWPFDACGED